MTAPAFRLGPADPPAFTRLAALVALDAPGDQALRAAIDAAEIVPARRELLQEGKPITHPAIVVSGWAARVRILADGRRQFLSFVLPGELIGNCRQPCPVASSSVVALTDVSLVTAPQGSRSLDAAYAVSAALEESHLLAQITRLGRMNAQERIEDLLLELHERLDLAGLSGPGGYVMPLTQEMLADALGLTAVHVNRTVQAMRRDSGLTWRNGRVVLTEPRALARKLGRQPTRVTAA